MKILLQGNPIDHVLRRLQAVIKGINVNKLHRISVPLYELGIWDFNRLVDAAGRHMIDTDALSRLPDLCSRVTARHKCSLNRLTLLLNGHDWMGQAAAHAYKLSMPLPKGLREVKRGLSMADPSQEIPLHELLPGRRLHEFMGYPTDHRLMEVTCQ